MGDDRLLSSQAYAKVRSTWPTLDLWRQYVSEPVEPDPTGDLAGDDEDWPPMPVSQVAWVGLAAASDHLQAIRVHLDPTTGGTRNLFPFAQFTLSRSALIGACQAVWVLVPEDRAQRLFRSRTVSRASMGEHLKYLQHLQRAAPTPHEGTAIITAHVEQRLSELDTIRATGGERGNLNVTAMIEEAATSTPDLNADHVAAVVASWRRGSAAAHGFHWAPLSGHDARRPTPEELATPTSAPKDAVLAPMQSAGSMVDLAENYLAAHIIARHGWRLIERRNGPVPSAIG